MSLGPSRQKDAVAKKVARGAPFAKAFADVFVSDKFGQATTHWRKLADRVQRGVGNPCPLVLVGLPSSIVTFDEPQEEIAALLNAGSEAEPKD